MDDEAVEDEVADLAVGSSDGTVESMNELHIELARKAARLAIKVLEGAEVREFPVASAVSLLKFGVDLERKALLGVEPDDGADPFDALAAAMSGVQDDGSKEEQ